MRHGGISAQLLGIRRPAIHSLFLRRQVNLLVVTDLSLHTSAQKEQGSFYTDSLPLCLFLQLSLDTDSAHHRLDCRPSHILHQLSFRSICSENSGCGNDDDSDFDDNNYDYNNNDDDYGEHDY